MRAGGLERAWIHGTGAGQALHARPATSQLKEHGPHAVLGTCVREGLVQGAPRWDLHSPGSGPEKSQQNTSLGTWKKDASCGPGKRSHLCEFPPEVADHFLEAVSMTTELHIGLVELDQDIQADCGEG